MPPHIRARNIINHYLDSINKPNKIELIKLIKIEERDIDNDYSNNQHTRITTDSEKKVYQRIIDSLEKFERPNGYYCMYGIKGIKHASLIQLDSALSKVVHFSELSHRYFLVK